MPARMKARKTTLHYDVLRKASKKPMDSDAVMSSLDEGRLTSLVADETKTEHHNQHAEDPTTLSELHPVVYEFLLHA